MPMQTDMRFICNYLEFLRFCVHKTELNEKWTFVPISWDNQETKRPAPVQFFSFVICFQPVKQENASSS